MSLGGAGIWALAEVASTRRIDAILLKSLIGRPTFSLSLRERAGVRVKRPPTTVVRLPKRRRI
jgi:hypothetical protein